MSEPEPGCVQSGGWRTLPRWALPAAGCAVLAVAATVLLVLRTSGAACAFAPATPADAVRVAGVPAAAVPAAAVPVVAVPAAVVARSGKATYYAADGGGNCSFESLGPGRYVALSPSEYAAGAACGGYLDVTSAKGTVRVKVTDQCPECAAGHIDLSKEAFAALGALVTGELAVSYRPVTDPQVPRALTARIKEGASRYWFAVRIDNHGNPLSTVEVRSGSGWARLTRTDYNYWLKSDGAGPGPFTVRIVDTAGHTATLTGISLTPGQVQQTSVPMYGSPTSTGATAASVAASTPGSPSPSRLAPTTDLASPATVSESETPATSLSPTRTARCG